MAYKCDACGREYEYFRGGVCLCKQCAFDECERLQAIVGRLPTCWRLRGGELVQDKPVVPPTTLFEVTLPVGEGRPWIRKITIKCIDMFAGHWLGRNWDQGACYIDNSADSFEAAEALRERG